MAEQEPSGIPSAADLRASLQELASVLRDARHLDPDQQQELADLVEELSQALARNLSSAEAEQLGRTAYHMVQGLHQQLDPDYLTATMDRLRDAAVSAEVKAPVATGIVWRLIAALTDLGI
jgi:hypothetical protein